MKRWLLIDDAKAWKYVLQVPYFSTLEERFPDVEFHTALTFDQGVKELEKGNWDKVFIDADLGGRGNEDGFGILELIKDKKVPLPNKMVSCSGNFINAREMDKVIADIYTVAMLQEAQ